MLTAFQIGRLCAKSCSTENEYDQVFRLLEDRLADLWHAFEIDNNVWTAVMNGYSSVD